MNDQEERDREFRKYCCETPLPRWFIPLISFVVGFTLTQVLTHCLLNANL